MHADSTPVPMEEVELPLLVMDRETTSSQHAEIDDDDGDGSASFDVEMGEMGEDVPYGCHDEVGSDEEEQEGDDEDDHLTIYQRQRVKIQQAEALPIRTLVLFFVALLAIALVLMSAVLLFHFRWSDDDDDLSDQVQVCVRSCSPLLAPRSHSTPSEALAAAEAAAAEGSSIYAMERAERPCSGKAVESDFGRSFLNLFGMDLAYTNLNFGSYGSVPRLILEEEQRWQEQVERCPDLWFRYEMYDVVNVARRSLSALIGAHHEDVVFVPNASTGINAVLRSLLGGSNSTVLYISTAYLMVKNTLHYVHDEFHENLIQMNITMPIQSEADVISLFERTLDQNPHVTIAVASHITSIPAITLPVRELGLICKERGILFLVDGAHAIGQIPINVTDLNCDFYVSNMHKWYYMPKGAAFLWTSSALQSRIMPTVISLEGEGNSTYQNAFSWVGTMDYSPYLTFPVARAFRECIGGDEKIFSYIHQLALKGGRLLAKKWKTELLDIPDSMVAAMVNVRLPTKSYEQAMALPRLLLEKSDTWVPTFELQGAYYTRVSAQIFNDISDFEMLADAVSDILSR
eukprot:TRINITY_DN15028_c0_g1_i1.p1 TRINITY_DN15028_c0_g1~~TRINITY_DN15028_c0_g1_i1.p1  ORF type:complete len:574 (-),score=113.46 TRINITY_DN15028_c0_g1_i1:75-1796(-)